MNYYHYKRTAGFSGRTTVICVFILMDSAIRTQPCRQPSYTKKRQVLAEEEVCQQATGDRKL